MSKKQSNMPLPPRAAIGDKDELLDQDLEDLDVAAEPAREEMPQPALPKPVPKRKIKVTANREGFMHQERKSTNEKFEVHEHELGSWMDCDDPVEQKKHLKRISDKKKKVNARAVRDYENELKADE